MEFKDVIYGRRSIRSYSDKPIPEDVLNEIIDAGLWAPSGVNLQPWYFVVIKSPEKMAEFKEIMLEISANNRPHLEARFSDHPEVINNTLGFIATLGNAPAAIIAFRDKPDYGTALPDSGILQSVSAAVENIVLSAYDHGLGTCWMTAPTQAHMEHVLEERYAPDHGKIVCMISLGYPEENIAVKAPRRKEGKVEIL